MSPRFEHGFDERTQRLGILGFCRISGKLPFPAFRAFKINQTNQSVVLQQRPRRLHGGETEWTKRTRKRLGRFLSIMSMS